MACWWPLLHVWQSSMVCLESEEAGIADRVRCGCLVQAYTFPLVSLRYLLRHQLKSGCILAALAIASPLSVGMVSSCTSG